MNELAAALGIGVEPRDLALSQILLRSVVVFFYVLALLRIAKRRFLAERSPLDVLLSLLLASMISRAINGSAPFVGTLAGGLLLVLLHRALAWLAFHVDFVARATQGRAVVLVRDGVLDEGALAAHRIRRDDLAEDMRLAAGTDDVTRIKHARFECNGAVSVEKCERIVELPVREGVQTVRIEING